MILASPDTYEYIYTVYHISLWEMNTKVCFGYFNSEGRGFWINCGLVKLVILLEITAIMLLLLDGKERGEVLHLVDQ